MRMYHQSRVLVLATSIKTRGGITSVIKAHQKGEQWEKFQCKWIETHIDNRVLWKLFYLLKALTVYFLVLPFYDIVHIHISEPVSAFRKCLFFPWAKLWRKKIIIHFHSFSPDTTIHSKYHYIYKYLFTKADKVIVLSIYWKVVVNAKFHLGDKVQIVYNPCTSEISSTVFDKKKQILYAGTINDRKGYKDLIRAFAIIATQYPNWQLVFCGNGEIEQGQRLATTLKIDKQIIFLGWVTGMDKDKAFKESMIFCLPSYAEGFPMAVLDAWAYGLPVITTPVGGISDIAVDGENILLFNPGDIEKLAMQIERMIIDKTLRRNIIRESINLSHSLFDIDIINKQIEELYLSL